MLRQIGSKANVADFITKVKGGVGGIIMNGWLVRNDARRMEDLAPLPGLDEPLAPLALTPTGNAANMAEGPSAAKALIRAAGDEVKAWMGHNGGPPLDAAQSAQLQARLTQRICDVLRVERPAEI